MGEKQAEQSLFSQMHHVGLLVEDADRVAEYYQSLGIGPFEPRSTDKIQNKTMYGKPTDFKLKVAAVQVGALEIEMIQPLENAPVHQDYLERKGDGIHHLAFLVNNIDSGMATMVDKGPDVILTARRPPGGGVYLDTSEVGDTVIELVQWPSGMGKVDDVEKKETGQALFRIGQVGVLVRDMGRAVEYYQSLGMGPFEPLNITVIQRNVYGKPADDVVNLARATQIGQVQFELIQPISGESVQREFLESKGEGINHLGFFVDDIDEETAGMLKKGFSDIHSGKFAGGGGFAYFDTDRVGGVQFELIQWPPAL